ncbi:hypothetical protein ACFQEX_15650 [Roseibium salinum]
MAVHGKWFYEQMVRWGQTDRTAESARKVEQIFSSAAYRSALGLTDLPSENSIRMFDGKRF